MISGLLVILSAIPYLIRAWQRKIEPNLVSWSIWTVIGLALLLTYRDSGAKANIWPAVFGFTNPLAITVVIIITKRGDIKIATIELTCLTIAVISLTMWYFLRASADLVQYALYTAIVADLCAAIPTILFVWKNPDKERPFAWSMFALAFGLAIFAVSEHTFANYVLPIYMLIGGLFISIPLIRYRWRMKSPPIEWI